MELLDAGCRANFESARHAAAMAACTLGNMLVRADSCMAILEASPTLPRLLTTALACSMGPSLQESSMLPAAAAFAISNLAASKYSLLHLHCFAPLAALLQGVSSAGESDVWWWLLDLLPTSYFLLPTSYYSADGARRAAARKAVIALQNACLYQVLELVNPHPHPHPHPHPSSITLTLHPSPSPFTHHPHPHPHPHPHRASNSATMGGTNGARLARPSARLAPSQHSSMYSWPTCRRRVP